MAGKRLGIVSTTINDEAGYLPFDRLAAKSGFDEVFFCIAGDLKTPDFDTSVFACPVHFLSPSDQQQFECSEEIGWNKVMRRNTALLRCIAEQPDFILMIDDDNVPPDNYFQRWFEIIGQPATRRVVPVSTESRSWHNYLRSADSKSEIWPRGFPREERGRHETRILSLGDNQIRAEDILMYQGISLGDPDIGACTREQLAPELTLIDESNYVLQDVWSPYNTQNTLFRQPLFPLACVWPFCGRFDDIFSSFTWQNFAFTQGKYIHVGEPLNTQSRRPRDIARDMAAEKEGYAHWRSVLRAITSCAALTADDFIDALIYLDGPEILTRHHGFFRAWKNDLRNCLGAG